MVIIKICSENYTFLKTQPSFSNQSPIKIWNPRFTVSNQYYKVIFIKILKIILHNSICYYGDNEDLHQKITIPSKLIALLTIADPVRLLNQDYSSVINTID